MPRPEKPTVVSSENPVNFPQVPRRRFLQKCAAVAAATGLPGWMVESRLAAAADAPVLAKGSKLNRPHIALIGCGGMGKADAGNAAHHGDVVAVCDVDAERGAEAVEELTKDGKSPELIRDFRQIMARDDIDVVVNATPDHWHSLVNLAAAKAGKDVYAEKPLTLTVGEGRRVVDAVDDSGIVLQTGSQQRSSIRFHMAVDLVKSGRIGKLQRIEVWLPAGLREGPFAPAAAPDHLNWDFWQGPAAMHSYVEERSHLTFRFWYEYSGGTMTDWGAHHIDIARWAMGFDAPTQIQATTLKDPVPGGYTAISDYEVEYLFPNRVPLVVRSTPDSSIYGITVNPEGQVHGIRFTGEDGWLWVNRGQLKASSPEILRRDPESEHSHQQMTGDHMANFFECVQTREKPRCHAEIGHRSASMCHLGVIALQTNRRLRWDGEAERFVGANARRANAFLSRELRAPFDESFIA